MMIWSKWNRLRLSLVSSSLNAWRYIKFAVANQYYEIAAELSD